MSGLQMGQQIVLRQDDWLLWSHFGAPRTLDGSYMALAEAGHSGSQIDLTPSSENSRMQLTCHFLRSGSTILTRTFVPLWLTVT